MARIKQLVLNKWSLLGLGGVAVAGLFVWLLLPEPKPKTEITTTTMKGVGGQVVHGDNSANQPDHIATRSVVVYESNQFTTPLQTANAAVLKWQQRGGEEGVSVEMRAHNGQDWSKWVNASNEDSKDVPEAKHLALLLTDKITQIQYRFTVEASADAASPTVDLSQADIELIDSNQGPSPLKQSFKQKVRSLFGMEKRASARTNGVHIYARNDWGSPEPDGSPRWTPEYYELIRTFVHHTATANDADPATTIRAIWHFHANSNDWGDIGYNYLVDKFGNIYQGRYFDHAYADAMRQDVRAGHTLNNNQSTTGVAALGDFTSTTPSDAMINSIANIIAYKMAKYNINPAGDGPAGIAVAGHRDALSTSCPGQMLYDRLPQIRARAASLYVPYNSLERFDYRWHRQGLLKNGQQVSGQSFEPGDDLTMYVDIENRGYDTWSNTGSNPVRLGTSAPYDRSSRFATDGWIGPNRAASFTHKLVTNPDGSETLVPTSTIQRGEIGRFTIPLKVPYLPDTTQREYFNLVMEGQTWFLRDVGIFEPIAINNAMYNWQFIEQRAYTDATKATALDINTIPPGARFYTTLVGKNIGNRTWQTTGLGALRVGTNRPDDRTSQFCDPSWPGCNRPATLLSSVAPGSTATFEFWVQAGSPAETQQFKEHLNLVADGFTWLNDDYGVYWPFTVIGTNYDWGIVSQQLYTDATKQTTTDANLQPNEQVFAEVKVRNKTTYTWTNSGATPMRLGANNPQDRNSAFCDPAWLGCNRPVALKEASVAPNEIATFEFWLRAPSAPGTYQEGFRVVRENHFWLRELNLQFNLTVSN